MMVRKCTKNISGLCSIYFYIKTLMEEGIQEDTINDGRAKIDNGREI